MRDNEKGQAKTTDGGYYGGMSASLEERKGGLN